MHHFAFRVRCFALLSFLMWGCSGPEAEDTPLAPTSEAQAPAETPAASTSQALEEAGAAQSEIFWPYVRYAHMTWHPVGPRTAEFSILTAFSREAHYGSGPDGYVVTGDFFTGSSTLLWFGDDPQQGYPAEPMTYEAIDHNVDEGWVLARAVIPPGERPLPGTGVTVPELEPNDGFDTAQPLNVGDDAVSELSSWQDGDYFRFTLEQQTRISVRNVLETIDGASLTLYSSTGQELGSSSYVWEHLELTLPPGTYFLATYSHTNYNISGRQTLQLREVASQPAAPITHTYTGYGPYTAALEIWGYSGLERVSTQVRFDLPNSSPVSTLQHLVTAPVNTPDFTLQIPATDAEGDELTFRLASQSESGIELLPPGLSISSSGLLTWDTTGFAYGRLSPAQVVIEEHRNGEKIGSSAVTFLLQVGSNHMPVCFLPRTDYDVSPGELLQFSITGSDPDPNDVLAMFTDGLPPGASFQVQELPRLSAIAADFSWRPSSSLVGSTYTVSFFVMDMEGNTGQCDATIHVVATPTHPSPVANAGPDQVTSEGAQVMLDGRGSSDPEGEALTYAWSPSSANAQGLLSSTTSPTPTFTPPQNGTYTFTLAVRNARGVVSTDEVTVTVHNVAPTVSVEGGGVAPGALFTTAGFITDPGADNLSGTVDYGDGSGPQPLGIQGRAFVLDHVYATGGTYSVTLSVQDEDGGVATATVQVVVTEAVPVVIAMGGSADEGWPFTAPGEFTATAGTSWTATVNYGDGSGWQPLALDGQLFTLNHTYADDGFYYVNIRVTDDTGLTGSATVAVQVFNMAPMPSGPSVTVDEGELFTTTVSVGDPGADRWTAWMDWGDWTFEWVPVNADGTLTLSHRYHFPGEAYASIVVYDDDGGEGYFALPVMVNNLPPVVKISTVASALEGGWWTGSGIFGTPINSEYSYAYVDYGDGTGQEMLNTYYNDFWLSHSYAEDGVYTVTVTVVEFDGTVGTDSTQVVVHNVAPRIYTYYPWAPNGPEGQELYIDLLADDVGSDSLTASIDYGDGSSEQGRPVGNSFAFGHVYANSGTYTATITVTDDEGATGTFTVSVNVWNVTPNVDYGGGWGYEGSVSTSTGWFYDPGAETGWTAMADFGDGTGLQPVTFTPDPYSSNVYRPELNHVYANDGYYMVTLYVTDSDGGVGMYSSSMWIENVVPEITMDDWISLDEGSTYTASGSFFDPGADTWTATVDYGDGSGEQPLELDGNTFQLSHDYAAPGVYSVTVLIWDGSEGWDGPGYGGSWVEVRNVDPVVTAVGGTIPQGSVFRSSGSFTDPGAGEWSVYADYGDGSWEPVPLSGKTFELSHLYEQSGTYQVTIYVWDQWGGGTATVEVVVINSPPVVSLQGASISEGEWLSLQGSFSSPAAQWTATVDYGDGSGEQPLLVDGTTFTLGHAYLDDGTYTVTVRVMDENGGMGTASAQVVVHNVAPTATASNEAPQYWGLPVHFSGTVTDPSGPDTAAGFVAGWAFGDGTTALGLSTTQTYANPGTYVAVLTAADKDGGSTSASTTVEIRKRPSSLTCDDTLTVYGFPVSLSAQLADALPGAQLGGRLLSFQIGASTNLGSSTTGSDGSGSLSSPGGLEPGQYTVTVSFAGDSHYTGAQAECSLTVTGSDGHIQGGGLRLANGSRGGFSVKVDDNGVLNGELRFKSASTSFHAHTMTALGISTDRLSGWFSGTGEDGRRFQAYVEDRGGHGTGDVFKLWIDGVLQTGDGLLTGGNIRIHREPIALAP